MSEDPILFEEHKRIGIVTFNRPELLNCFNIDTLKFFDGILNDLNEKENLKVIIFTGKGRSFSTGNDLKARMPPDVAYEFGNLGRICCLKILNSHAIPSQQ